MSVREEGRGLEVGGGRLGAEGGIGEGCVGLASLLLPRGGRQSFEVEGGVLGGKGGWQLSAVLRHRIGQNLRGQNRKFRIFYLWYRVFGKI